MTGSDNPMPDSSGTLRRRLGGTLRQAGLLAAAALPLAVGLLGAAYAVPTALGGAYLLVRNVQLLRASSDRHVALASFHASNLFLLLLFLGVVVDVLGRR